jgi:hypothetical protein
MEHSKRLLKSSEGVKNQFPGSPKRDYGTYGNNGTNGNFGIFLSLFRLFRYFRLFRNLSSILYLLIQCHCPTGVAK